MKAMCEAQSNIALVKYWGKRDEALILPHQSSLSVTLAPLSVETSVEFGLKGDDEVFINSQHARGSEHQRVVDVLHLVRKDVANLGAARVVSRGNFPKAAGLASSAAAFAALAVAARAAAGLARNTKAESILARRGSGSACRSILGGYNRWHRGHDPHGHDSFAEQVATSNHWPDLRLMVAMVSTEEKEVKSRDGMRTTVETSPYYSAWAVDAENEVEWAVRAIEKRDLTTLGEIAERSAFRMHATALAAKPPICYLKPKTLEIIETLARGRRDGIEAYFTLDAGPNPVVVTNAANEAKVTALLKHVGVKDLVPCHPGSDAKVELGRVLEV